MTIGIEQFHDLWGQDRDNYVLVRSGEGTKDLADCVIFNTKSAAAEVIEDDDLAIEVIRRMVAAGVPVLDRMPKNDR